MNDCRERKKIQTKIFWDMWHKIKLWCEINPVEKMDYFKNVNFHKGFSDAHQTYIGFDMNTVHNDYYDDKDAYYEVGRWSLTLDKHIDTPVMLHMHALHYSHAYYLKSDMKRFVPIIKKNAPYGHKQMGDYRLEQLIFKMLNLNYRMQTDEWHFIQ